jgi:uncharacterized paraquat-inducible protein A
MDSNEIQLFQSVDPNNASSTLQYYGSDDFWNEVNNAWMLDSIGVAVVVFLGSVFIGIHLIKK